MRIETKNSAYGERIEFKFKLKLKLIHIQWRWYVVLLDVRVASILPPTPPPPIKMLGLHW